MVIPTKLLENPMATQSDKKLVRVRIPPALEAGGHDALLPAYQARAAATPVAKPSERKTAH